ncbi:MAG: glycosyltransferase [Desulfobacterales bacterium]|jgi:glycosyltransferase involved in cell wall biosynthesis|nr:glycosyltransferase [Desulfobacterales bacterium]MDP6808184.1 glycosyltransferase [Desulfobacterales bacterium]|tara:strand:+ start:43851 stop:44909 length:1059 start_codon:yes stop_codon:yes gene_type:complete
MTDLSVLMTVYDGMPYLPLSIESILCQTFSDFEFIIVNDCSTDESIDVIRSYHDSRIRIIENDKNLGQTKSLNKGLEYIRTEFVARMDADDISHKQRLEKQCQYLDAHPDVAAVGTNLKIIDPNGNTIGHFQFPENDEILRWMQLFDCPVSCGAVMFRKSIIWDQLKGFDPTIRYAQDWELWSRVLPRHKLSNVPDFLLDVREHPGASSIASNQIMREEQFRINRLNPNRILGIQNNSDKWIMKVDTLLSKRVMHPEHRMDVINVYYKRFRELYPHVSKDPAILKILAEQYLKLLYHTNIRSLPKAIRVLLITWQKSSINFSKFPRECLLSIREIPGHIKFWGGRNILRLTI